MKSFLATKFCKIWSAKTGNTEQGKCRLTNEYPLFLFFIGHWYYEKKIVFIKTTYSCRYSFVACNSWYAWYSLAKDFWTFEACKVVLIEKVGNIEYGNINFEKVFIEFLT